MLIRSTSDPDLSFRFGHELDDCTKELFSVNEYLIDFKLGLSFKIILFLFRIERMLLMD